MAEVTYPIWGGKVLVDEEDLPIIAPHKWCAIRSCKMMYAITSLIKDGKKTSKHMHSMLMPGILPDHKNRNGLDNRRSNLRAATAQQNSFNSGPRPGTSKFKGVSWDKTHKKWVAELRVGGKGVLKKRFSSEIEAAKTYDEAAKQHQGEFAYLNFPEPSHGT